MNRLSQVNRKPVGMSAATSLAEGPSSPAHRFRTSRAAPRRDQVDDDAATIACVLSHVPMGRLGSVQDVAHAVSFLVSPQAGCITGAELHVNSGMYMG